MLSVIIPCYNEESNLEMLFAKVITFLTKMPEAEVVLVNNGSTDSSLTKMNTFKLENPLLDIRICSVKVNEGYGFGILSGLNVAKNEILAWTHADLQTDLMDCIGAYQVFEKENNQNILVKGFRKERKLSEVILSYGMALLASSKLKKWLTEINAQPKMFHKSFYDSIKKGAPKDFSLDLYFCYEAKKKGQILTIPVKFIPRIAGEAKGGSGSSLKTKVKIVKRTLKFIKELGNKA